MKRNKFFMLGIVTVLVAVLSLTFVSNTFAKYTSTVTGSDTAKVAKWAFTIEAEKFGKEGKAFTEKFAFNLFDSIVDTVDGNPDAHVAANVIAPGTKGTFDLNITNNSEVNATYEIDFTVTNGSNIPLEFTVDGADNGNTLTNIEAVELAKGASTTITIAWEWPFEGDDGLDTSLGINEATITVEAEMQFTQVD